MVEARLDRARGPISTLLVEEGTLRLGDLVVAGEFSGKIRAMLDDKGQNISEAGPSTPVEVLGLDGVPDAGEMFNVVDDEKAAKSLAEHRREARRKKDLAGTARVSLENILDKIKSGDVKEVKIVLKADVQGSVEAIANALTKLLDRGVGVNVISSGVGGITESDVSLAKASAAMIIGFNVRPAGKAAQLAEQEGVDIKLYQVIYEAIDDVKKAMVGMLAPMLREKVIGPGRSAPGLHHPQGRNHRRRVRHRRQDHPQVPGAAHARLGGGLHRQGRVAASLQGRRQRGRRRLRVWCQHRGLRDVREGDIIESFEIESMAPRWRTRPDQPAAVERLMHDHRDRPRHSLLRGQPFAQGEADGHATGEGSGATQVQRGHRGGGQNELWQRAVLGITVVGNERRYRGGVDEVIRSCAPRQK